MSEFFQHATDVLMATWYGRGFTAFVLTMAVGTAYVMAQVPPEKRHARPKRYAAILLTLAIFAAIVMAIG